MGESLKSGEVILARLQFTDSNESKLRPAVILFEELDNIVVAGITSNPQMQGIPLTKNEGAITDSVIKLNYIFTITCASIAKKLFELNNQKKKLVYEKLTEKLRPLNK